MTKNRRGIFDIFLLQNVLLIRSDVCSAQYHCISKEYVLRGVWNSAFHVKVWLTSVEVCMVWGNPCSGYCLPFVGVENTLNREVEAGKESAVFEWQGSWLADVQVSVSLGWVFQFQAGGKEWVESACETEISALGFTWRNLKQLSS